MTKQKLYEYCQKNRITSPQFVTTGQGVVFSSAVVVQCLDNAEDCRTFYSKEVHTSKKKAENDAAEVALDVIGAQALKSATTSAAQPSTASTLEDFLRSVAKIVKGARPGIFDQQASVPVEFLLLYSGVQSALNRIDLSFRKNAIGAYSYLLKALYSPLQDFLILEEINNEIFVKKASCDPIDSRISWRGLRAKFRVSDSIKFIVIPSSPSKKPYETSVDICSGRNKRYSNNDANNNDNKNYNENSNNCKTDSSGNDIENEMMTEGLKYVQAFSAIKKTLNISGSVAITAPIYTSTLQSYLNGISQIFNGEEKVDVNDVEKIDMESNLRDENDFENNDKKEKGNNWHGKVEDAADVDEIILNTSEASIETKVMDQEIYLRNDVSLNNNDNKQIIDQTNQTNKKKNSLNKIIVENDIDGTNSDDFLRAYSKLRLMIPYIEPSKRK